MQRIDTLIDSARRRHHFAPLPPVPRLQLLHKPIPAMKLDPAALRYLSDDDFRVLTAVEMGMRNHELVPIPLISAISGLRHGGYMRALKDVHKNKLVHKESKRYVGYRLTSMGYDYLALRALVKRGVIHSVGRAIGVGKEADVFIVAASEALMEEVPQLADDARMAMKLHRLGRTSFRAVKNKRDYLVHRKSASWIYFSRLAAMKEYAFMCALHERGFPVPRPMGQSRHVVVMELCKGVPLTQVTQLDDALGVARGLLHVVERLAKCGLVHCDLNEFNVIADEEGEFKIIDFPQMVSTCHADAEMLFDRDVNGICKFFEHRFGVREDDLEIPVLRDIRDSRGDEEQLDAMVAASGFKNVTQSSDYGVQDTGGDFTEGEDAVPHQIDMKTLQLSIPAEEEETQPSSSHLGDIPQALPVLPDGKGPTEEAESATDDDDQHGAKQDSASALDRTLIETRVRRQRANQSQRRQTARRNVVKDSEKRKVKNEIRSGFWD